MCNVFTAVARASDLTVVSGHKIEESFRVPKEPHDVNCPLDDPRCEYERSYEPHPQAIRARIDPIVLVG